MCQILCQHASPSYILPLRHWASPTHKKKYDHSPHTPAHTHTTPLLHHPHISPSLQHEVVHVRTVQVIRDALCRFAGGEHTVIEETRYATYPLVACYVDIRDMDRCRGHYAGDTLALVWEQQQHQHSQPFIPYAYLCSHTTQTRNTSLIQLGVQRGAHNEVANAAQENTASMRSI